MAGISDNAAPEITDLCPLLQVFDMLESVRFYCTHLGFQIDAQSPMIETPYPHFNWALLKRGAVQLMLNTAYEGGDRPPSRDTSRIAAHADTILYFGCPRRRRRLSAAEGGRSRNRSARRRAVRNEAALLLRSRRLRHLPAMARVSNFEHMLHRKFA
jgi:hypothetical protein